MHQLLDAAAANEWQRVAKISKRLGCQGTPQQRRKAADQWVELHGHEHLHVIEWLRGERKAANNERRDVETMRTRPPTLDDFLFAELLELRKAQWWKYV